MLRKALALASLAAGIFLLIQVVMPIASYKFWELTFYNSNQTLISPSPGEVAGVSVKSLDNYFPALYSTRKRELKPYDEFDISIPSINFPFTKVAVDSNNFETNLAHLPGSALPGERGNIFITGHSSLPQFYRPDNFKAIFAHLPDVKKGDMIIVRAGGQNYTYLVEGLKIVDPSAVWVINPPDADGRYLSLMTCVPPGLFLKRLIVISRLQS